FGATLRFIHVMSGDEDRFTSVTQVIEEVPNVWQMDRIEARGRFIEKEKRRVVHQRATERDQLPHPARQTPGRGVAFFPEISEAQQIRDTFIQFRYGHATSAAEKAKILLHREVGIQTEALCDVTKLRPHLFPFLPDVVAGDGRFSAGRMRQAAQHPNGRRLASAVSTKKSKDCPRSNGQGNFPYRLNVPKMLAQLVEHDHWFIHFRKVIAMAEQDLQPGNVPLEVSA